MSEAPEKIWARFRLTRVFAGSERVAGGTEYVRADLAEALRAENERLTAERDRRINGGEDACVLWDRDKGVLLVGPRPLPERDE